MGSSSAWPVHRRGVNVSGGVSGGSIGNGERAGHTAEQAGLQLRFVIRRRDARRSATTSRLSVAHYAAPATLERPRAPSLSRMPRRARLSLVHASAFGCVRESQFARSTRSSSNWPTENAAEVVLGRTICCVPGRGRWCVRNPGRSSACSQKAGRRHITPRCNGPSRRLASCGSRVGRQCRLGD